MNVGGKSPYFWRCAGGTDKRTFFHTPSPFCLFLLKILHEWLYVTKPFKKVLQNNWKQSALIESIYICVGLLQLLWFPHYLLQFCIVSHRISFYIFIPFFPCLILFYIKLERSESSNPANMAGREIWFDPWERDVWRRHFCSPSGVRLYISKDQWRRDVHVSCATCYVTLEVVS